MSPKPPKEPESWPCRKCELRLTNNEETFDCTADGCLHGEQLCVGCIYVCDDCENDFCREHIVETPTGLHEAEYRCVPCQKAHERTLAA